VAVRWLFNLNAFDVNVGVPIGMPKQKIDADTGNLTRVDGIETWSMTIPAGAKAVLRYRF
jgi:hypothetical protein